MYLIVRRSGACENLLHLHYLKNGPMNKPRLLLALLCLCGGLGAQQLSLFTQYRENATLINPAAMETDFLVFQNNLTVGLNYRRQWAGLNGSPETQSVRFSYINDDGSGASLTAGAYLLNDQTGPTGFSGFYGRIGAVISPDPAYSGLSLALTGGVVQYRVDASEIRLRESNDIIGEADQSQLQPDVGVGIYFYNTLGSGNDMLYAGVSAPQLLGLDLMFTDESGDFFVQRTRHYYGTFGVIKYFYNDSYLEPTLWVKYVEGAPINADVNLRYQLPNALWIGTGLSTARNFHFETGLALGSNIGSENTLRLGYGFDYSFSSFGPSVGSTHELQVSFSFD